MKPERFTELAQAIQQELGRVIVGQSDVVKSVLMCVIAGRHILLEGVPGLGKTLLIRTLADVITLKFARIQFTPDLMPADITGTNIIEEMPDGKRVFRFQEGAIFANLVLADEINRATPKTQSALLEAMQEKSVTVGGVRYALQEPFFVLATQNPIDMEGTYPLPEAQLDRFMLKVLVDFPSQAELVDIMTRTTGAGTPTVQAVVTAQDLLDMRQLALEMPIATHLVEWVAKLIIATHPGSPTAPPLVKTYVSVGASPRGAQSLILGAKIGALLNGRYNVANEDIRAIALSALRHRLLLNYTAQAAKITADAVIQEVLSSIHP